MSGLGSFVKKFDPDMVAFVLGQGLIANDALFLSMLIYRKKELEIERKKIERQIEKVQREILEAEVEICYEERDEI